MKTQDLLPFFWNIRWGKNDRFCTPGVRLFFVRGVLMALSGFYSFCLFALPSGVRPSVYDLHSLPRVGKGMSENLQWLLHYMRVPRDLQAPVQKGSSLPKGLPKGLRVLFQTNRPALNHLLQTLQPGEKKFQALLSFLEKHLGRQEVMTMMLQVEPKILSPPEMWSLLLYAKSRPPPARGLPFFTLLYQYSTLEGIRNLDFLGEYIRQAFPQSRARSILKTLLKHPFLIFNLLPASDLRDTTTPFHRIMRFLEEYTGGKKALVHLVKASLSDPRFCVFDIPFTTFQANVKWVEDFINTTGGFEGSGKNLLAFHLKSGWFNHQLLLENSGSSYRILRVGSLVSQASLTARRGDSPKTKERLLRKYILPPSSERMQLLLHRQKLKSSLSLSQCLSVF